VAETVRTSRVTIAGGGVSGLAAATLLARGGAGVDVYDRHIGGGGRFKGGWQVLENATTAADVILELEGYGLREGVVAIPAREALLIDGLGGAHRVASETPYAYFIRRGGEGSLDAALRRSAVAAGAVLHDGAPAPAGCDVIATGPRQADGAAREVVFSSDLPDTIAVLFDPRITPTGYAYLFCLGGHATFGVAQVRRVHALAAAQRSAWGVFRAALGEFAVRGEREGGQFMNFALPAGLRGEDGRWYAGEAAGVQDFLFGLGNRLAIRSAALAAGGILGSWDERRFRTDIVRLMRCGIAMRCLYELAGRRGLALLSRRAARGDFRRLLRALQGPGAVKETLARTVMPLWRERRGCRHAPLCRWCRRREGR
jgi:flavin-dependent dehydrogenase